MQGKDAAVFSLLSGCFCASWWHPLVCVGGARHGGESRSRSGASVSSSSGSDPITLDDAPDAKPVAEPRVEGQIGRLDVFRDGRVNFRFGDGLVMEVTGGSQASFLQQVMIIDGQAGRATTMGELHRKFVVAPEIASMLADADLAADEGDARTDVNGIA